MVIKMFHIHLIDVFTQKIFKSIQTCENLILINNLINILIFCFDFSIISCSIYNHGSQ
jgi:hypothetical protein